METRMLLIAVLSLSAPISGFAEQLFVQLGAYRDVSNANVGAAQSLGEVQQQQTASGLTRFRIVGLATRSDAQTVLQAAREAGYSDAFIGGHGSSQGSSSHASSAAMAIPAYSGPSDRRINAARAKVPTDQHGNIVYLDGKLMLKEGEHFRPLE